MRASNAPAGGFCPGRRTPCVAGPGRSPRPDAGFSGCRSAALRAAFFGMSWRIVAPHRGGSDFREDLALSLRGGSDFREDLALSLVARRIGLSRGPGAFAADSRATWRDLATLRPKRGDAARRQSAAKIRHPDIPKIRRPAARSAPVPVAFPLSSMYNSARNFNLPILLAVPLAPASLCRPFFAPLPSSLPPILPPPAVQ